MPNVECPTCDGTGQCEEPDNMNHHYVCPCCGGTGGVEDEPEELMCDDCGQPGAEEGFDPYASEIRNEEVPCTLCHACSKRRSEEI